MSILRMATDPFIRFFRFDSRVDLHFNVDERTAEYVRPLIEKLVSNGEDGETYRMSLAVWQRSERPPLAHYHGDTSVCRIDGPLQWEGDEAFPLGGLILSPGITAHLDPFEALALSEHMRSAIERAILEWVAKHEIGDRGSVPEAFDRAAADREARALIADWAARRDRGFPFKGGSGEGPEHV